MKRRHYIALAIIFIWFIIIASIAAKAGASTQCNANNPINCPVPTEVCDNGEHIGNPHCNTPTPTPTICPKTTPTVTPTVTPTPTQEVTPTPTEVTVTPTASPTPPEAPIPNLNTAVAGASGTQGTPICTVGDFAKPILQGFKRLSPTSVEFFWWPSSDNADKQTVAYGLKKGQELSSTPVLPGNQGWVILNDLWPNQVIWAQVTAYKGDCNEKSEWLDP